jgi:hypothetical protein
VQPEAPEGILAHGGAGVLYSWQHQMSQHLAQQARRRVLPGAEPPPRPPAPEGEGLQGQGPKQQALPRAHRRIR